MGELFNNVVVEQMAYVANETTNGTRGVKPKRREKNSYQGADGDNYAVLYNFTVGGGGRTRKMNGRN